MTWFKRMPSLSEFRVRVEKEIEILLLFRPWQQSIELPPRQNETYFAWLQRNQPSKNS